VLQSIAKVIHRFNCFIHIAKLNTYAALLNLKLVILVIDGGSGTKLKIDSVFVTPDICHVIEVDEAALHVYPVAHAAASSFLRMEASGRLATQLATSDRMNLTELTPN